MGYDIYGNPVSGANAQNWAGKTIVFDGDSLTSGYGLPEVVCELLGANCVNVAISATSIGHSAFGTPGYFRERMANYPANADAFLIHGDINAGGAISGDVDDTTEDTAFGRWNIYLRLLKAMYPTIPVFIMSTFQNYPAKRLEMAQDFSEAFHKLAARHGCIHIDLGTESQFNMVNAKSYNAFSVTGTQNVHQNREVAEKLLYPYIAKRINQYVPVTTDTPDTGVTIDQSAVTVAVGSTVDLTATITPDRCLWQNNAWTTSDKSIAYVSGGQVYGVAAGTATITVTTKSGHTATCSVTVTEAAG